MHRLDLIDRIVEMPNGEAIRCEKRVPAASPVFDGHFPDFPVVPGVLLIEAIAQAGGFLVMARLDLRRMALMVGVRHARFHRFVRPEDALTISGRIRFLRSTSAAFDGRVCVDGQKCCQALVLYRLSDFPTRTTRDLIARKIGAAPEDASAEGLGA